MHYCNQDTLSIHDVDQSRPNIPMSEPRGLARGADHAPRDGARRGGPDGAAITTRGVYVPPGHRLPEGERKLYLLIQVRPSGFDVPCCLTPDRA